MSITETVSDSVLRKVRGLLDQAEATPFPEEADAFNGKAMEMITRYRIDVAMLEAARPRQDRGEVIERDVNLGSGPYVRARLSLIGEISEAASVRVLSQVTWEGRVASLIGYEADVTTVEVLYTSLLAQAATAAKAVQGKADKRTFLFAFSIRVGARLRDLARATVADVADEIDDGSAPGVALVLADRKADASAYIDRRYGRVPTLGRAAPLSGSGNARSAGYQAGERADIGLTATAAPRKTLA